MSTPNRAFRRRHSKALQAANIVTMEEVERYGHGLWVTLVEDPRQEPGRPVDDEHRILCHPDDMTRMEQLALAYGLRVRVEGAKLNEIGRDQPYDVAAGYLGGSN